MKQPNTFQELRTDVESIIADLKIKKSKLLDGINEEAKKRDSRNSKEFTKVYIN